MVRVVLLRMKTLILTLCQDLGLGVLEQKNTPSDDDRSESDSKSEERAESNEKDVMGKLMGRESGNRAVGIHEVGDV